MFVYGPYTGPSYEQVESSSAESESEEEKEDEDPKFMLLVCLILFVLFFSLLYYIAS